MYLHRSKVRTIILAVVAAIIMTVLIPATSFASTTGRRNTAIGLTGLAAYLLIRGNTAPGLAAAAGAGYAWNRVDQGRRYGMGYGYPYFTGYYVAPSYPRYGHDRDRGRDNDRDRDDRNRNSGRNDRHDNDRWDRGDRH